LLVESATTQARGLAYDIIIGSGETNSAWGSVASNVSVVVATLSHIRMMVYCLVDKDSSNSVSVKLYK